MNDRLLADRYRTHSPNACQKDGRTIEPNVNASDAFMCADQQPWAVTGKLSYAFAGANWKLSEDDERCCACYELNFKGGRNDKKRIIVQVTTFAYHMAGAYFDIKIPGGGVGGPNVCGPQ